MVRALIIILILSALFTVGGISALINGETTGLPLAVGGTVLDLACIALVTSTTRVPRSLIGDTISRSALATARRTTTGVRGATLATIVALLAFGLVRAGQRDPWSAVTAVLMSIMLAVLARGTKRLRHAQDRALGSEQPQ
jgi:hypothetical protein